MKQQGCRSGIELTAKVEYTATFASVDTLWFRIPIPGLCRLAFVYVCKDQWGMYKKRCWFIVEDLNLVCPDFEVADVPPPPMPFKALNLYLDKAD